MSNNFLEVSKDVISDNEERTYVKLDTRLIRGGLLANLTATQLKVLLVIASYMNENNESYPSIDTIALNSGATRPTVIKAIKDLEEIKFEDVPILQKRSSSNSGRAYNIYTFSTEPTSLLESVSKVDKETIVETNTLNSVAILRLFTDKYSEVYGTDYKVNYRIDCSRIKNTLIKNYSDDEIRDIVNITIEEYGKRWSSPKYPIPTVGAMCSWICNNAIEIRRKRMSKINTSVAATEVIEDLSEGLW